MEDFGKGTFPYDKHIQFLIWMVLQPEKSFIMGGSWRIPVLMKLLDSNFITDLKQDGTFNEMSFDREYRLLYSLNIVNCWEPLRVA